MINKWICQVDLNNRQFWSKESKFSDSSEKSNDRFQDKSCLLVSRKTKRFVWEAGSLAWRYKRVYVSAIRDLFPRKVGRFDALCQDPAEREVIPVKNSFNPAARRYRMLRRLILHKVRKQGSWQDSVTAALDFGLTPALQGVAFQQLHLRNPDLSFVLRDPMGNATARNAKSLTQFFSSIHE